MTFTILYSQPLRGLPSQAVYIRVNHPTARQGYFRVEFGTCIEPRRRQSTTLLNIPFSYYPDIEPGNTITCQGVVQQSGLQLSRLSRLRTSSVDTREQAAAVVVRGRSRQTKQTNARDC